ASTTMHPQRASSCRWMRRRHASMVASAAKAGRRIETSGCVRHPRGMPRPRSLMMLCPPDTVQLFFVAALEELSYRLEERPPAVQHVVHLFGDRHVDAELPRQAVRCRRGRESFGHRALLREIGGRIGPLGHPHTESAVAREIARAG